MSHLNYLLRCLVLVALFFFRLNDSIIPNRGYVKISDLSFATLDCLTTDHQHEGNWISPDGTTVDSSGGSVPGFMTTRGPLIVRLLRTSGTPQQGIQCVVQNDTAVLHTVHVGLYNSGEGIDFCVFKLLWLEKLVYNIFIHHLQDTFNCLEV